MTLSIARAQNRVLKLGLEENKVYSGNVELKHLAGLYVRFHSEAWIQAVGGPAQKSRVPLSIELAPSY